MNITFDKTTENADLLKAIASKNRVESQAAQDSLAAFMGPVIQEIITLAPTLSSLFEPMEFSEFDSPSIPLDLYTDVSEEGLLQVWSQMEAGGQPFNFPTPPTNELKFHTYRLDSAVAFHTKYARGSRMDVIAKTMTQLAQTILLKQERNSAGVLLKALAAASTQIKKGGAQEKHIIRTKTADTVVLADYLSLFTLHKRIRSAWEKGTPSTNQGRGLTDLIVSPEFVEKLRGLAFNPIASGSNTDFQAHENLKESIYNNAGIPSFYNVAIQEINELGVGYKYNDLFKVYAGSETYANHGGGGSTAFNSATEEIAIGLDRGGMNQLIRPVAYDADTGDQFTVEADDQFTKRSGKIGWYGALEEGRVILDDKVLSGLIV